MITPRPQQDLQIKATRIFLDFNDPQKHTFIKRVGLALSEQQSKMRAELDSNSHYNLQILVKKQQELKHFEEKLHLKDKQIGQLKSKLSLQAIAIAQLQSKLPKGESKMAQQKSNSITIAVNNQVLIKPRGSMDQVVQNQQGIVPSENAQKGYSEHQHSYSTLRYKYQKVDQPQDMDKSKQVPATNQSSQNQSPKAAKNGKPTQRHPISNRMNHQKQHKLSSIIQKDLRGLLALNGKESPSRKHQAKSAEIAIQTDQKVATPINILTMQKVAQTQKTMIHYSLPSKHCQSVQVNLKTQSHLNPNIEIEHYKARFTAMREFYENRYQELKRILERQEKELQNIEHYKLEILQLELRLEKRQKQFANQRQILTTINQQLEAAQSQNMMRKFSSQIHELKAKKSKELISSSIFLKKRRGSIKQEERKQPRLLVLLDRNPEQIEQTHDCSMLSPKKWEEEQAEIITVIKKANNLTFFDSRRRSTTEPDSPASTLVSNLPTSKRTYRGYSTSKKP